MPPTHPSRGTGSCALPPGRSVVRGTPLVVLTAIVLLLSGCTSSGPDETGGSGNSQAPPGDAAGLLPSLLPPSLVGTGGDTEASLVIGHDGTILVCSHGGFRKPSPMWASTDGGNTFEPHAPGPNPVPSGDCDNAVADDGTWYVIYNTLASVTVASSADQGRTWRMAYAAALPIPLVDRPWIATVGSDAYLTYTTGMAAEPSVIVFARSTDGGVTWTEHRLATRAQDGDRVNAVVGHLLVSPDGRTVRIPIVASNSYLDGPQYLELLTSHDGGQTWRRDLVSGPYVGPPQMPGLARAADGSLYLTAVVGPGTKADVVVFTSLDEGASWSAPITVVGNVSFPFVTSVWADGSPVEGTATLAWMHFAEGKSEDDQVWVLSAARVDARDQAVHWVRNVTEPAAVRQAHEFSMVRHDAKGNALFVYPLREEGCADANAMGRSAQCILLVRERDSPTG